MTTQTNAERQFRKMFVAPGDRVADRLVSALVKIAAGRDVLAELVPDDGTPGDLDVDNVYWLADDAIEAARSALLKRAQAGLVTRKDRRSSL